MKNALRSMFGLVVLGTLFALATPARAEGEPAGQEGTAAAEHEAGAHHASFDAKTFGLQILNFGVLIFILVKFGGKAVNKALAQRHEALKAELAEAARLRAEAEESLKQQVIRMANLERELAELRTTLRREADAEKGRMIGAAEERARRIQHETQFLLEQQVKEAELRFKAEVAAATSRIAEQIIRRDVTHADQARLTQSFVAEVEAGGTS